MSPVPNGALAREAMKELSARHPNLTMHQLILAMKDASWNIEADKATCAVRVPQGAEEIEINIVQADQS
jgi:hypothetical protein